MYVAHELYESEVQALGAVPLWRYIGLDQLIGLLTTRRLWLSPMTTMDDQAEGLFFDDPTHDCQLHQIAIRYRLESPVSCWSAGLDESLAMWKSYTNGHSGIVLKSDVASVVKSLGTDDCDNVWLGVVQYVDSKTSLLRPEGLALTDALFRKRAVFSYENEVRLVSRAFVDRGGSSVKNLNSMPSWRTEGVAVDLATLIREVRVSPFAESWFLDSVRETTGAFGLADIPVEHSEMRSVFEKSPPCVDIPQFRLVRPNHPPRTVRGQREGS